MASKRQIRVGNVPIGGGAPVVVQSMTLTKTWDVEATIGRKQRDLPPVPSQITGEIEARLIALACSKPPEGHARW